MPNFDSKHFSFAFETGRGNREKAGGLHNFMKWNRPLMTDSGGFQVFSLGFGRDLKVGKILKGSPGNNNQELVHVGAQPKFLKITDEGVYFRSPIDGRKLFLGPKESMKIQEKLGADVIFAFDECTPPLASQHYIKEAIKRTHDWAKICVKVKKASKRFRHYARVKIQRFAGRKRSIYKFAWV